MKKIVLIFSLLYICACPSEIEKSNNLANSLVEIEFFTTEPNFDEIIISYYQDATRTTSLDTYTFSYDLNGDPLPLKIILDNYTSRYIDGEAFRENHSPAKLSVKLYINGELILEDASRGTAETFATVNFKHTISN